MAVASFPLEQLPAEPKDKPKARDYGFCGQELVGESRGAQWSARLRSPGCTEQAPEAASEIAGSGVGLRTTRPSEPRAKIEGLSERGSRRPTTPAAPGASRRQRSQVTGRWLTKRGSGVARLKWR